MTQPNLPPPDYTLGFSEEMLGALMRRNVADNAAYLLPHLKPGMLLLDVGCGPGSISLGLAQAVAPGEVHGIDIEATQISLAGALAAHFQQENVVYQAADAANLPFADGYFDVIHCHDVLMHIADTDAVLAEVMRVLKPGGIFACREMVCESCYSYPDFGVLGRAWDMFEDVVATGDGHPQMGKELKDRLANAGFIDSRISASFEMYSTPDDIQFIHSIATDWFLSQEMQETAISFGAATEDLAESIRSAYDRWLAHPGALCALAFGEAVAFKAGGGRIKSYELGVKNAPSP